jgi:hypothetical protein
MANIKKSFNFRNGVQVDDDNFIVNPNGLVGIGSTIPTESLDVLGNIRVRGSLYVDSIEADSIINTSDTGSVSFNLVNVGITSITSGIVSATSGIVTYYGDGSKLQGLPTSQWVDVDPDLNEYTSIYSVGNVGIATTNPIYTLQIGGNYSLSSFGNGVGIASEGDIRATRDITIGRNLNVTGITTIGSNLYVTGIATAYSFSGFGTNLTGINASNISSGTLNSARLPANINSPLGIGTFSLLYGNLVGIATTARGLTSDANIDIISLVSDYSVLGIATASFLDVTNSIGVGTDSPNSDFHVRKNTNAKIEVTSDSNASRIILGTEVDNGSLNSFGFLRFGNTNISENSESTNKSLDIVNYAPGNLNYYIRPQSLSGLKFNWINYSSNIVLASLTSDGRLGLGKTNPTETFEVVGTSTITSNLFVGGDFRVSGSINGASLNVTGSTTLNSTTINGSVGIFANSPNYTLQIGNSLTALGTSGTGVGISSSGNVVASGIITASRFVGIGSNLTLLNPSNISSGTISNISIDASTGIITTGTLNATTLSGIGSNITSINPNNISPGTITDVSINSFSGIITASQFVGSGSSLVSIRSETIIGGSFLDSSYVFPFGSVGIGTTNIRNSHFKIKNTGILCGVNTFEASSGVTTFIDQFDNSIFKYSEYSLHFEYDNSVQIEKVILTYDNVGTMYTTYGSIFRSSRIVQISSSVVGGFSRLEVTPNTGINGIVTYRYEQKLIEG